MKTTKVSNVNRDLELHFGEKWNDNKQLTFYKDTFEQQVQIEMLENCIDDE